MQLKFTQTDGFVYDLLHFLWLKDPITRTAPLINIPYTIQILSGQAKFWYFSKDGIIFRKSKEKLDPDYLENVFAFDKTDKIEAAWIYLENDKLKFNYMNQYELSNFISRLDYKANGVLQAFIYPKGENNSTIKCIWQENSCIFEYIYNINKMKNKSLSVNQRITTFETDGGPTLSVTLNSNTLARTLNLLCKEIKQHILNVTFEQIKITLMELYFRTGIDGKIYLLLCSKIRTTKQRSSFTKLQLKVPLAKGPNRVEIINQRCIGCKIIQNQNIFEDISIKEIIESWDKNHQITYKQDPPIIEMDKNCLIPKILRFIYPNLEFNKYQSLKYNVGFTTQKIRLCLKCYRDIINNKIQFSTANYSIQKRLLLRQKSSQSTFYYDTQSMKKTIHSQDSFNCNTQSQTKNSSSHKRSISTVSMVYKQKCYTHNNFTQSISQIFKNEQDYNLTDKKIVDQIQIIQ